MNKNIHLEAEDGSRFELTRQIGMRFSNQVRLSVHVVSHLYNLASIILLSLLPHTKPPGSMVLIFIFIFLFLDSPGAALHDSMLAIIFSYFIMDLGATVQLTHCLKTSCYGSCFSDSLPIVNRFKDLNSRSVRSVCRWRQYPLSLTSYQAKSRKTKCSELVECYCIQYCSKNFTLSINHRCYFQFS